MKSAKSCPNPILTGFHPDPTICRVGEDFYLCTSSFSWFPGLPIYHSRDLVHWRGLGYAWNRQNALDFVSEDISDGLYAPTLRWHGGIFYLACTRVDRGRGEFLNFVLTARDPAGPWSKPKVLKGVERIDPCLFFASNGEAWLLANRLPTTRNPLAGDREIWLAPIDPDTLQPKQESRTIWCGFQQGAQKPEGPRLFHKDGWYYLITAEGGTGVRHAVIVARSRSVEGPYQGCPWNPVLTHRHLGASFPIQSVGHADWVETSKGEWWAVCLGMRPSAPGCTLLGRETFLVQVEWEEEWPVFSPGLGQVLLNPPTPNLPEQKWPSGGVEWFSLFGPLPEGMACQREDGGWDLQPKGELGEGSGLTGCCLARRLRGHRDEITVDLPEKVSGEIRAGLTILQSFRDMLRWEVSAKYVRLARVQRDERRVEIDLVVDEEIRGLRLTLEGSRARAWILLEPGGWHCCGPEVDLNYLSVEVTQSFTGCHLGFFAEGKNGRVKLGQVKG